MAIFTCFWCLRLEYNSDCVYYTSFIFDAWLFLLWSGFGFHGLSNVSAQSLAGVIISICLLVMGVWAIIHLFTKSRGGFHKSNYVYFRLMVIYGLLIGAIILLVLWILLDTRGHKSYGLYPVISLVINAAILHGYHENFSYM